MKIVFRDLRASTEASTDIRTFRIFPDNPCGNLFPLYQEGLSMAEKQTTHRLNPIKWRRNYTARED